MHAFAFVAAVLAAGPGTLASAAGATAPLAFLAWVPESLVLGPVITSPADLLRLVAVPVLGWAAYRDVETRRVPNRTWTPLIVIALVALALDAVVVYGDSVFVQRLFVIQVVMSLMIVGGLAYAFWWIGGFGGADAKALMTLSLLYPTYPPVIVRGTDLVLPLTESTLGVFSLTILTNTVVIGVVAPVALAARNAARSRFTPAMFIGRPIAVDALPTSYGRLLETPDGFTRGGLDLDALRMYLRWRGTTLADLRTNADAYRDPDSIPDDTNHPGDGSLAESGEHLTDPDARPESGTDRPSESGTVSAGTPDDGDDDDDTDEAAADENEAAAVGNETPDDGDETPEGADESPDDGAADPWGAAHFFAELDGTAYGTTPTELREGLDVLAAEGRESVWVTPGMPFIVPMFFGLLVALVYGDVLFAILAAIGLV